MTLILVKIPLDQETLDPGLGQEAAKDLDQQPLKLDQLPLSSNLKVLKNS